MSAVDIVHICGRHCAYLGWIFVSIIEMYTATTYNDCHLVIIFKFVDMIYSECDFSERQDEK